MVITWLISILTKQYYVYHITPYYAKKNILHYIMLSYYISCIDIFIIPLQIFSTRKTIISFPKLFVIHLFSCVCVRVHVSTREKERQSVYTCVYVCVRVCVYDECVRVCIRACVFVSECVCVCVCLLKRMFVIRMLLKYKQENFTAMWTTELMVWRK